MYQAERVSPIHMEVYGFVLVSVFVNVCILVTVSVSGLHYTRDDLDSLNAWIPADLVLYNIVWVFLSMPMLHIHQLSSILSLFDYIWISMCCNFSFSDKICVLTVLFSN